MLESNAIPDREPMIKVGVVLPEDAFRRLEIEMPKTQSYLLKNEPGETVALKTGASVDFRLNENALNVFVGKSRIASGGAFTILPAQETPAAPRTGLLPRNVIAGRVFHWKKKIDVFIPGALTISAHEGCLIAVNTLPFEHYVMCVAASEMSAACPEALIQAQTIAARSWMLANVEQKHRALGMDVCNDDCCQRYQGSTFLTRHAIDGVLKTRGEVLLYDEKICDARYSKSCGGMMESFDAVWGGGETPYLQVKLDAENSQDDAEKPDLTDEENFRAWLAKPPKTFCGPEIVFEKEVMQYLGGVDVDGRYFRWQLRLTEGESREVINQKTGIQAQEILGFESVKRAGSGRLIRLNVIYKNGSGSVKKHLIESEYAIRDTLHKGFLYSSAIVIDELPAAETDGEKRFKLTGCGWGHGVGLCQIGALGMALQGYSANEILPHYYPGAQIRKIY